MLTTLIGKWFAKWLQILHEIPLSCELHSTIHFLQRHVNLQSSSKWFLFCHKLYLQHLLPLHWKSKLFMISTWLIKISWPHSCPWILSSFVSSQVRKKSCNESSHGAVHYKLDKLSKPARLAHLSSFEFIFIHYSIFYVSFTLDIFFFNMFFQPILLHALCLFSSSWLWFLIMGVRE